MPNRMGGRFKAVALPINEAQSQGHPARSIVHDFGGVFCDLHVIVSRHLAGCEHGKYAFEKGASGQTAALVRSWHLCTLCD